tara:strand:+ start:1050 stop:1535 length:486 start_codon:yes stop_codon:yes gene_type:complete
MVTPRKNFESKTDRDNEMSALDALGVSDKYDFCKLPISYRLDFAMIRKRAGGQWFGANILAFVEVKNRSGKSTDKNEFSISALKITHGLLLCRATQKPFLLVVRWKNETLMCNVSEVDWRVQMGGRVKSRRDAADVEPMMTCDIESSFVTPKAFFNRGENE